VLRHLGLAVGRQKARALALAEVGIPDRSSRSTPIVIVSGGQQQRVMIAMAIACEPKP
jgi:peptide/nickel transport system ATP-binding protein